MSNVKAFNYPGYGEWAVKNLSYAQAVRVGDRIICSGQGTPADSTTETQASQSTDTPSVHRWLELPADRVHPGHPGAGRPLRRDRPGL